MRFSIPFRRFSKQNPLVVLGLVLGVAGALWSAPVMGVCFSVALLLYLRWVSERWADPWPFRLFLAGFLIRFGIISLISALSVLRNQSFTLFGDSQMYFDNSLKTLKVMAGFDKLIAKLGMLPGDYGYSFLAWIYGALYLIFGYSPFLALLVNAAAGCLAGWMIYLITCRITGHRKTAALAMGLVLFWPSQIMWSVALLKETVLALYGAVVVFLIVDLISRKHWWNMFLLAVIWYPLGHVRLNVNWLALIAIVLSLLACWPRRVSTRLALFFSLAVVFLGMGPGRIQRIYEKLSTEIVGSQVGFILTGGATYQYIPDRFLQQDAKSDIMSPREMTTSYLKAIYYYLSVPSPFKLDRLNKLPVLPQMLIWYALLIVCFPVGVLYIIQHRFREGGAVLIYLFVFASIMALATGNEGAAFRQRDMIIPFFFIPISIGFMNLSGCLAAVIKRRRTEIPAVNQGAV